MGFCSVFFLCFTDTHRTSSGFSTGFSLILYVKFDFWEDGCRLHWVSSIWWISEKNPRIAEDWTHKCIFMDTWTDRTWICQHSRISKESRRAILTYRSTTKMTGTVTQLWEFWRIGFFDVLRNHCTQGGRGEGWEGIWKYKRIIRKNPERIFHSRNRWKNNSSQRVDGRGREGRKGRGRRGGEEY